jgi:hypothetical protein
MKSGVYLFMIILSLVPCWNAFAQEETLAGEASLSETQVEIEGNRVKFNEYRDLRGGVYGHIGFHYDAEKTYLDFRANNIGRRDQEYELGGGEWGSYSYSLRHDEIPHNFGLSTTLHR